MPKGGDVGDNPLTVAQSRIAQNLYRQTDPIRRSLIGRSQSFLEGDLDPTQSPAYGAFKSGVESQYARARDATIGDTPAGGALSSALADLEARRADTLAQGAGRLSLAELDRAQTLGTGTTGQSLDALGSAAYLQQSNLNAALQREADIYGALGSAGGSYLGNK